MVTEYECREASRFSLRSWEQWLELDEGERAMAVAHYRVHNALEANISDAHSQHIERQARRGQRGRRR